MYECSGWIWGRVSNHRVWKDSRMLLCNIRCPGDRSPHSHYWKQLQQILRPPEEVGEARNPGCLEEVSEFISNA